MSDIKVLWVDDEIDLLKPHIIFLENKNYDVTTAKSGTEAIEEIKKNNFDIVFLDENMPGLTGPNLQRELSDRNSILPIIFLTAYADVPTGITAMKEGAVDFLLKPVEEKKLFEAIDKALDQQMQMKMEREEICRIKKLVNTLTQREYETLQWVITGMLNKQIASSLHISERTVKAHRSQIMQKLNVVSVAQLVRLTQKVNISPACPYSNP